MAAKVVHVKEKVTLQARLDAVNTGPFEDIVQALFVALELAASKHRTFGGDEARDKRIATQRMQYVFDAALKRAQE